MSRHSPTTIPADDGLIAQVDGFFGSLSDIAAEGSAIPLHLQPPASSD